MNRSIAFDLETIADQSLIPILPAVKPKSNLKDQAKIEADIREKKVKQVNEMGLNPLTNLICALGWCDGEKSGHILLENETDEKRLLNEGWELLSRYDHFITFNGFSFDVPILNLHSLRHRIRPGVRIDTRKYQTGNHTDLRMILSNWDQFALGKLDFYLKLYFGSGKPEDIDGSMVQDYWNNGLKKDIGIYAQQDAVDTFKLYQFGKAYFL